MKKIDVNKISNLMVNEEKFKRAHYEYLTTFSHLEMLISYCIASYYCENEKNKIEFTLSFLANISRPKLFEEFLIVIEKKGIIKDEILENFKVVNDLRNDFAHSYFVPKKENLKNGFCITKIFPVKNKSNIEGFTKIIQDDDYEEKFSSLTKLKNEVYFIYIKNFKV